jgi:hypothetical protein
VQVALIVLKLSHLLGVLVPSAHQLQHCVSVRNLDKSGRGFLTNEKVYALMAEQLAMQTKIFQFKKIIIG